MWRGGDILAEVGDVVVCGGGGGGCCCKDFRERNKDYSLDQCITRAIVFSVHL